LKIVESTELELLQLMAVIHDSLKAVNNTLGYAAEEAGHPSYMKRRGKGRMTP
jgi:hypothetical protein